MPKLKDNVCVETVVKATKGVLSEDKAKELLSEIQKIVREEDLNKQGMLDSQVRKMIREKAAQKELEAVKKARAEIYGKVAENGILGYVEAHIRSYTKDTSLDAIITMIEGTIHERVGGRHSINLSRQVLFNQVVGKFDEELSKIPGGLEYFASRQHTEAILNELHIIAGGDTFGWSAEKYASLGKDKTAIGIAKAIHDIRLELVARANRAGATIQLLPGYTGPQSWNGMALRMMEGKEGTSAEREKKGFAEFQRLVSGKLNVERTFGRFKNDPAKSNEILLNIYRNIRDGGRYSAKNSREADAGMLSELSSGTNIAEKMSEHRELHFNSPSAWLEVNSVIGNSRFEDSVLYQLESMSRNVNIMERLGPTPMQTLDRVVQKIISDKERFPGEAKDFQAARFRDAKEVMIGTTRQVDPEGETLAMVSRTWGNIQQTSKGGFITLSSIPDIANVGQGQRFIGQGMDAWSKVIKTVLSKFSPAERQESSKLLHLGYERMISLLHKNIDLDFNGGHPSLQKLNGLTSSLLQKFNRMAFIPQWADIIKTASGHMTSNFLAKVSEKEAGNLSADTLRFLKSHAITSDEWDVIRNHTRFTDKNGEQFLVPKQLYEADKSVFEVLLKKEGKQVTETSIKRKMDELAGKFAGAILDESNIASLTMDAKVERWITGGSRQGEWKGTIFRALAQFKSSAMTLLATNFGREIYGRGAENWYKMGAKGALGLVQMVTTLSALGYASRSFKDALRGREPNLNPTDPKVWAASFLQGGAFGVYGDFMFGEFNRFGKSALSTAAGPTFGQLEDVVNIWGSLASTSPDPKQAMATFSRMIQSNTPFANWFMTKAAFDYAINFQLLESLNPGYLQRMENRLKKDFHQEFFVPPSQVIQPFSQHSPPGSGLVKGLANLPSGVADYLGNKVENVEETFQ